LNFKKENKRQFQGETKLTIPTILQKTQKRDHSVSKVKSGLPNETRTKTYFPKKVRDAISTGNC